MRSTHPVLSTAAMCYIDGNGKSQVYYEVYSDNDKCEGTPMLKGSSDGADGGLPFAPFEDNGESKCLAVPTDGAFRVRKFHGISGI